MIIEGRLWGMEREKISEGERGRRWVKGFIKPWTLKTENELNVKTLDKDLRKGYIHVYTRRKNIFIIHWFWIVIKWNSIFLKIVRFLLKCSCCHLGHIHTVTWKKKKNYRRLLLYNEFPQIQNNSLKKNQSGYCIFIHLKETLPKLILLFKCP